MNNLRGGSSFRSFLSPFHRHWWVFQSFWSIKVSFVLCSPLLFQLPFSVLEPFESYSACSLPAYCTPLVMLSPDKRKPQAENPCFKTRSFNVGLRLLKLCSWRAIMRNILYLLDAIIHLQEDKEAEYIFAQIPLLDKGWPTIPVCLRLSWF